MIRTAYSNGYAAALAHFHVDARKFAELSAGTATSSRATPAAEQPQMAPQVPSATPTPATLPSAPVAPNARPTL